MNAPAQPDDRPELHNASVDAEVAKAGGCGNVHLATGRTCTLEQGHEGSCYFVEPDQVDVSRPAHGAGADR